MSNRLQCYDCKALFTHEDVVVKFRRGTRETPDEYSDHCPECDSDDLDEVTLCRRCGEVPVTDGSDNCAACDAAEDAS